MFEEPAVPWTGRYSVCFCGKHGELLDTVERVALVLG